MLFEMPKQGSFEAITRTLVLEFIIITFACSLTLSGQITPRISVWIGLMLGGTVLLICTNDFRKDFTKMQWLTMAGTILVFFSGDFWFN